MFHHPPRGVASRLANNNSSEDLPTSRTARPYRLSPAQERDHIFSTLRERLGPHHKHGHGAPSAPLISSSHSRRPQTPSSSTPPTTAAASSARPTNASQPDRRPHSFDGSSVSSPSANPNLPPPAGEPPVSPDVTRLTAEWFDASSYLANYVSPAFRNRGRSLNAEVPVRTYPHRPAYDPPLPTRLTFAPIPPFTNTSSVGRDSPPPSRPSASTPRARALPIRPQDISISTRGHNVPIVGHGIVVRSARTPASATAPESAEGFRQADIEEAMAASLRDRRAGTSARRSSRSPAAAESATVEVFVVPSQQAPPTRRPRRRNHPNGPPPPYSEEDPRPAPSGAAIEEVVRELSRVDTVTLPPQYHADDEGDSDDTVPRRE